MLTDQQLAKLPRYARNEIARLTINVEALQGELDVFSGTIDSPVSIATFGLQEDRPLPNRTVKFSFGCSEGRPFGNSIGVRLQSSSKGTCLYVNGSRSLRVQPVATNCFEIYMEG